MQWICVEFGNIIPIIQKHLVM